MPRWQAHQGGGSTRDASSSAWAGVEAASEAAHSAGSDPPDLDPEADPDPDPGRQKLGPRGSRNSSKSGRICGEEVTGGREINKRPKEG